MSYDEKEERIPTRTGILRREVAEKSVALQIMKEATDKLVDSHEDAREQLVSSNERSIERLLDAFEKQHTSAADQMNGLSRTLRMIMFMLVATNILVIVVLGGMVGVYLNIQGNADGEVSIVSSPLEKQVDAEKVEDTNSGPK